MTVLAGTLGVLGTTTRRQMGWTPEELTTALWLDASDASTKTVVSDRVTAWADKSGNGRTATPIGVNGPLNTGQQGSRTSLVFAANNGLKTAAWTPFPAKRGLMICAFKLTGAFNAMFAQYPTVVNGFEWFASSNATANLRYKWYDGATTWRSAGNDPAGWCVGSIQRTADTQVVYRRDSVVADTYTTANQSAHSGIVSVGTNTTNGEAQGAEIGEALIVNGTVSTDDRQLLEGYLAHKWGTAASLPSDHPYKSEAP